MNSGSYLNQALAGITFDLITVLEKSCYVEKTKVVEMEPAEDILLSAWEEANSCTLPEDLKQFYRTMNGMTIQWSAKLGGQGTPVGEVKINSIDCLTELSLESIKSTDDLKLEDIDEELDECDGRVQRKTTFKDKCFEISSSEGKVCLVYKKGTCHKTCCASPEIWFLDRSLRWHYLSSTFRQYMRMAVIHMGIKGWQYLFTDAHLSPETTQWFSLFIPHRICLSNEMMKFPQQVNAVDFIKLFKNKN